MSPRTAPSEDVDSFLPLPTAVFHILVALADQERHGYAIMQDVAERTDGKVRLSAGTLNSAVRRMLEQGLIEEVRNRPPSPDDDERRRYYRLTRFGRRAAEAEAGERVIPAPLVGARRVGALAELLDQAVLEHAADGAVERAGAEFQRAVGAIGDVLHDRVAVAIAIDESEQNVKGGRLQRQECGGFLRNPIHIR